MHFPSFCGQHAAVTAIDSHVDAFPNALADKAVSSIADQAVVKPAINGRITTLLGSMDAAKVKKSAIPSFAARHSHFQSN